MADVVAIGLRALAYAAALAAAGLPIFVWLERDLPDDSSGRIRAARLPLSLVALAALALHALVEPVRLAGSWSGILDPSLHALLLTSDFGTTNIVRAAGLLLIAASPGGEESRSARLSTVGSAIVAASFALMGHTAADPLRWLLAPLLFVHLLAVAFWFGSLWPLLTAVRLERAQVAGMIIRRFSETALRVVPLVLVAGLAMTIFLLPGLTAIATPYGLSLAAKFGGFALLMALAAVNRWRLTPQITQGDRSSLRLIRVSIIVEWVLILAVIAVTAVMTARFSPGA